MADCSPYGRPGRLRRVLVLPVLAALTGGIALTLVPMTAQADARPTTATVVLRTPGSPESLAQAGAMPRAARLSRLQSSVPSAQDQSALLADASSLGLTVDSVTPWSAVVRGPASAVQQLAGHSEVASVLPEGGPAPVPAAAATQLWGYQLRDAYQASGAKPAGTTPIIATIQFSGWDSSLLGDYVSNVNQVTTLTTKLPALPAGAYTAVSVGSASTSSGGVAGGATEVALDQESIYAVNPYAKQRAYFTSPGTAGLIAALNRVAADALNMPGLVALSISWTFCETDFAGLTSLLHDMHQAMANLVAAGVTVFAASGDNGTSCNGDAAKTGANYPASDPLVVAVGGTSLTLGPTAETAWGGSGGGTSAFFPEGSPVKRTIPDVAGDADVSTGFDIWQGGWGVAGGTSLATPVSAASYVAELAARGAVNGGLGDLHSALNAAPTSAFRDITSGGNGSATAGPGYDLVTGHGAPLWNQLVSRLLAQPVIQVPASSTSPVIPVTVTAPAGQTFIAWQTGSGTPPGACATSAGKPSTPASVQVPGDGTWTIWAAGYVGYQHCFIVSTTTVVTGHPVTPPPVTTSPAPVATTGAPKTTTPPVTASPTPVHTTLPVLPVVSPTDPPLTQAPPGIAAPVQTRITTDVTPPAVSLSARQTSPGTTALSYSWNATDTAGSGVQSVAATVFRDGKPVWTASVPSSSSLKLTGVPGHAYRLGVVAVDEAGNVAGFTSGVVRLPYDDRAFRLGRSWHRVSSRNTFGGSYVKAAATGTAASVTVTGSSFSLLTATGPADGVVAVYVDGRHVRDVALYSKATHTLVKVALARFRTAGKHRITLLVKGTKAAHAKGTAVVIDGLLAY